MIAAPIERDPPWLYPRYQAEPEGGSYYLVDRRFGRLGVLAAASFLAQMCRLLYTSKARVGPSAN